MKCAVRLFLLSLLLPAVSAQAGAKNVILMIGDGMGFNAVQAGSLYNYGAYNAQPYWPYFVSPVSTWSLSTPGTYDPAQAWSDFEYFKKTPTDSAAAATALSAGVKTHNGMIQMTQDGTRLEGLVETAEKAGKATGILSTVYLSHATPACFGAHDNSRKNVSEIAQEMVLECPVDVIIAPGHPWFDDDGKQIAGLDPDPYKGGSYGYVGGEELWRQLQAGTAGGDANGDGAPDAWTLVDKSDQIKALGQGDTPARVFGIVPVHATLRVNRTGDITAAPYAVPALESLPTMSEMMLAALNTLDNDPDGFFLMGEGGAIDWAAHGNQLGRLIEEQTDFDNAIMAVMDWVDKNSNWDDTLLIVTADHETGYLWGPGSNPDWLPLENRGKGQVPGHVWPIEGHTNQLVPLFARGVGVELLKQEIAGTDLRLGDYVDNTRIPAVIRALWQKP